MNSSPSSIKDLLAEVNAVKKRHLEKREQHSQAVQDYVIKTILPILEEIRMETYAVGGVTEHSTFNQSEFPDRAQGWSIDITLPGYKVQRYVIGVEDSQVVISRGAGHGVPSRDNKVVIGEFEVIDATRIRETLLQTLFDDLRSQVEKE